MSARIGMRPVRRTVVRAASVILGFVIALVCLGAPHQSFADTGPAKVAEPKNKAKPKGKKPTPLAPLNGTTIDFKYDGKDVGHKERAWLGRAFVHKKVAADAKKARPLLVFVHGINQELIKYRWMGGGNEGDVRRIVSELIENGQVEPMIVAAPSSIVPQNIVVAPTSWMGFDLDHFVEKTAAALSGVATIDKTKIIVAGHSGGGCNVKGGIATAIKAKNVHSALVIDVCMGADLASALCAARSSLNMVVSYQMLTWGKRPVKDFRTVFEREVKKAPAQTGILRVLEQVTPKQAMPHDAMVPLTLKKWLPQLVPVSKGVGPNGKVAPASTGAPSSTSAPASTGAPVVGAAASTSVGVAQ